MASRNSSVTSALLSNPALQKILITISSLVICGSLVAVVTKLALFKVVPKAWKCCMLCQDIACFILSLGLLLVTCHVDGASVTTCKAGGFFLAAGTLDVIASLAVTGITFLLIQNPTKMSQLSTFRWQVYLSFLIPQKILTFVLAAIPVSSLDYFDTVSPYPLACFPVRQEGGKGAAFGAILIFIMWSLLALALIVNVIVAVRFWAGPGTRVHASTPSLWQTQKIEQSKTLQKFTISELTLIVVTMFIVTIVVYTNSDYSQTPQWVALSSLVLVGLVHVVLAVVQLFLWSGLCCDTTGQKKEPHHRLKQLELIRMERPGKLRLKVSWAAGKGIWKRGLLKVYGPAHIKAWAQEIVVLGLLRKLGSASVLRCLWTSNTNPYYETMTLISGDIVTSDSRLTCLELTPGGTLQELLKIMKVPLPETCQRNIMHDIAEGLSCLHDQNVLHRNLTSAAVYLKGSIARLVIRAAVGDFEDSQIYGTLLTGCSSSTVSKKQFFYPDIRAYALVGLEMLARVCESRRRDRQLHCGPLMKASTDLEDTVGKHGIAELNLHLLTHGQRNTGDETMLVAMDTDNKYAVKRFLNPEIPYCAPGEPEYFVDSKKFSADKQITHLVQSLKSNDHCEAETTYSLHPPHSAKTTLFDSEENKDKKHSEYKVDDNWKLQTRTPDISESHEMKANEVSKADDATKWEEHTTCGDVSQIKEPISFKFPNYSIFRKLEAGRHAEDLDLIEEKMEQFRNMKFATHRGHYKQAGYVTSITDTDGREIFIPATYRLKKSGGNSSSGYGSCSGSTTMLTEQYASAGAVNNAMFAASISDPKRLHNVTSIGTSNSFEEEILEVLPAIGDSDYKYRQKMKDLLKAKGDARVEQLITSYEERVRKGHWSNGQYLQPGVTLPISNSRQYNDTGPVLDVVSQNSSKYADQGHQPEQVISRKDKRQNEKLSSHSPLAVTKHRSNRNVQGSKNASNSSFQEWNARSSLKRNKARKSLKKALMGKSVQNTQKLSIYEQSRGMKVMEIERKYCNRHDILTSRVPEEKGNAQTDITEHSTDLSLKSPRELSDTTRVPICNSKSESHDKDNYPKDKSSKRVNHLLLPNAARNLSVKNHVGPLPPNVSYVNTKLKSTHGKETASSFDNCNVDEYITLKQEDESFTTVEPTSTDSEYTNQSSSNSHEHTNVDKIEADMNDIIQSNALLVQSNTVKSLGIKLIDSGFDSASVSSEESCLCAAAALQIPEEGSSSNPSDMLSQGRCSCACSSCLESIQGFKKESSWPDSPDSESWNNSNSFSSYDNNMHRRKLPSIRDKENSNELVLAPDDKYPSPVHRHKSRSVGSMKSSKAFSQDKNHQCFSHSVDPYSSSASEASSAVSKRYKELIKRGVSLRVSVISGDDSVYNTQEELVSKADAALKEQKTVTDIQEKNNLCKDIELKGTFKDESHYFRYGNIRINSSDFEGVEEDPFQVMSPIPSLEEIIKEIPDETGCFPEETKAFLNRPDSELSVKALQAVLSRHGSNTDKEATPHSELIIDTIFSQRRPSNNLTFNFSRGGLELDESAVTKMALFSTGMNESTRSGLLCGVDGRHVNYCHTISDGLIDMSQLLPANSQTFNELRSKLQQNGNIGLIGNQILDLIGTCWLDEAPPTMEAIVNQLTDHVMETEL